MAVCTAVQKHSRVSSQRNRRAEWWQVTMREMFCDLASLTVIDRRDEPRSGPCGEQQALQTSFFYFIFLPALQ